MTIHNILNAPKDQPHTLIMDVPALLLESLVAQFQRRHIAAWPFGATRIIVACGAGRAWVVLNELAQAAQIADERRLELEAA